MQVKKKEGKRNKLPQVTSAVVKKVGALVRSYLIFLIGALGNPPNPKLDGLRLRLGERKLSVEMTVKLERRYFTTIRLVRYWRRIYPVQLRHA